MRCLLLAFALGVLALQQQAELPSAARAVWIGLPLAIALLFYGVAIRASTGWRRRAASYGALLSAAVAIGLGGFFYADSLSAIVVSLTAFVSLVSSIYAVGYFRRDLEQGRITARISPPPRG